MTAAGKSGILVLALQITWILGTGCEPPADTGANSIQNLLPLVAEPDRRIGDFDDPDLGFSSVYDLDVDHEGNVYVLESQSLELRVFDSDGDLVDRIGREGSGPGEFEGIPRFGVVGDTVWAIDGRANRITLFDRRGAVLSTGTPEDVTVPLPSSFGHVLPRMMRPDGRFIGHFSRVSFGRDEGPEVTTTERIPWPFVLFEGDGSVADTIGWAGRPPPRLWRPPSEESAPLETIDIGGRRTMIPPPPSTRPWWLPLNDGYVLVETPPARTADDGVFTVTRIGLNEDTVYHRTFRYAPTPYSSEDLDSIAARAARGGPGGGVPAMPGQPPPADWEAIANRLRGEMDFPPFQLPVESAWLDQDERVWLRVTADSEAEQVPWVLLDSQGLPRGRLELPSRVRPLWSRGDTFWAVEPGELDVPWVVRYSIRAAENGE